MKSIIKEIFYGRRGHSESIKSSKDYFEFLNEIPRLYEELKKELPDEKKALLEQFCELRDGMETESADIHFIEGVKLGILLGMEACN